MSHGDERVVHGLLGCVFVLMMLAVLAAMAGGAFWIWRIALER